jgi:hypothetical protein
MSNTVVSISRHLYINVVKYGFTVCRNISSLKCVRAFFLLLIFTLLSELLEWKSSGSGLENRY